MSKKAPSPAGPEYPPLGTLIDNSLLELVEVLGNGGYGIVYRAVESFSTSQRSYAVKCLSNTHGHSSLRRQLHIREISLHKIASAHPSVVALYRVIEEPEHTFIVMEYATDHDLFTQILHKRRYLGDDALIKHVFLQMIDGVEYCHSLGIYHRDLKPENVLCFDGGFRVAITDFGLATTEKSSKEFRTGSVYHMSPECQAGDAETVAPYSPMHNDIWSLGIILLNLVTGRNPWKSAIPDDPTYEAYRQDPLRFLPSVLPISEELNDILVQTLDIDWRGRLSLSELRAGVQNISTFYSANVIFEGSLARCPWEAGLDLGTGTGQKGGSEQRPVPNIPEGVEPYCVLSMSAVASTFKSQTSTGDDYSEREPWERESPLYNVRQNEMDMYEDTLDIPYGSSGRSSYSSDPSEPATPSSIDQTFYHGRHDTFDLQSVYDYDREQYYDAESTIFPSFAGSSTTDTDDNRFASSVFLATPVESKPFFHRPDAAYMDGYRAQKRYSSPSTSAYSVAEALRSKFSDDSGSIGSMDDFPPSSPNYVVWPEATQTRAGSRPIDIQPARGEARQSKPKPHNIFNPMRFFPRSSGSSWLNTKTTTQAGYPAPSARMRPTSPPSVPAMPWADYHHHSRPVAKTGGASRYPAGGYGTVGRSGRDWI